MSKETFILAEYINPETKIRTGFGETYRTMVSRSWERVEKTEVQMTCDEVKAYLKEISRQGRFVEAIKDKLVWACSEDYPVQLEGGEA